MERLLEQFTEDRKLKILLLKDSEDDNLQIYQFLKELEIPFQVSIIGEKEEYVSALTNDSPDIVISDFNHPAVGGLEALELRKRYCPGVPFIFITSFLGEDRIMEILKKGATDFVLKENLFRLNRRIVSSLRETEERNRRTQVDSALRKSEAKYRLLRPQIALGTCVGYIENLSCAFISLREFYHSISLKAFVRSLAPIPGPWW